MVPEKDAEQGRIARLIFRNSDRMIENEREVPQFKAYIGSIAGLYKMMLTMIEVFWGPYLSFLVKVKWVKVMYNFNDQ